MKKVYKDSKDFKNHLQENGIRQPIFEYNIEYARVNSKISNENYHLIEVRKFDRKREAYELDIKKEKRKNICMLFCGPPYQIWVLI